VLAGSTRAVKRECFHTHTERWWCVTRPTMSLASTRRSSGCHRLVISATSWPSGAHRAQIATPLRAKAELLLFNGSAVSARRSDSGRSRRSSSGRSAPPLRPCASPQPAGAQRIRKARTRPIVRDEVLYVTAHPERAREAATIDRLASTPLVFYGTYDTAAIITSIGAHLTRGARGGPSSCRPLSRRQSVGLVLGAVIGRTGRGS
jgi:hypothetical protein